MGEENECYGCPRKLTQFLFHNLIHKQTWEKAYGMFSGGSRILYLHEWKAGWAVWGGLSTELCPPYALFGLLPCNDRALTHAGWQLGPRRPVFCPPPQGTSFLGPRQNGLLALGQRFRMFIHMNSNRFLEITSSSFYYIVPLTFVWCKYVQRKKEGYLLHAETPVALLFMSIWNVGKDRDKWVGHGKLKQQQKLFSIFLELKYSTDLLSWRWPGRRKTFLWKVKKFTSGISKSRQKTPPLISSVSQAWAVI